MIDVGVVVIGRNEGERLKRCLASVAKTGAAVVYVDSDSTDGSIEHASAVGAEVVALDLRQPFTAARARNAGVRQLVFRWPSVEYVQFVDGDCDFVPGWLERARKEFDQDAKIALVCGRLRERNREATVYNRLCDMEWHRRPGRVHYCGGIVMARRRLLEDVGGYNEELIAGEDPELCVRIREAGGHIVRLPDDMAFHDAAMTRFGQWWKRTRRSGWAYAAGAALHGSMRGGHNVREVARAVVWGLMLPVVCIPLLLASLWNAWCGAALLAIAGLYAVVALRVFRSRRMLGEPVSDAALYAVFCLVGKPAECVGVLEYWFKRVRKVPAKLIEYK